MNFVGFLNAGSCGIDLDHREERGERPLEGEQVAQFLLDHVADHPLGLGTEHVEGICLHLLVRGALQGEQSDLRAVAVANHQLMLIGDRRQRFGGDADVATLVLGGHRLSSRRSALPPNAVTTNMAQSPSVATRIALIVCIRFSACSNARLYSDSNTSLVTSRPFFDPVGLGDLFAERRLGVVEGRQAVHEFDLRIAGSPSSDPC